MSLDSSSPSDGEVIPSNSRYDSPPTTTASTLLVYNALERREIPQNVEALKAYLRERLQDRPASPQVQFQPPHPGSTLSGYYSTTNADPKVMAASIPRPLTLPRPPSPDSLSRHHLSLTLLGHYGTTNAHPRVMAASTPRPLTPPRPPSLASSPTHLPPIPNYPRTTLHSENFEIPHAKSEVHDVLSRANSSLSARTLYSTYLSPIKIHRSPDREPPAWRLNYKIGTGACGSVFLENVHVLGMKSPELWAVKRIPRGLPNFTFKRYEAEINNLQVLARHEWFVKFNSTYEDTHYMYIAMEYIPMGDMSQSFTDGYRWNESDTQVVIKQLLHGLAVMHKDGITHRDLKPENIFLYLPENQTHVLRVKIGDFGTSKRIPPSSTSTYLKTTTGTQGYMAPEVHDTSQPKTDRVDIWSLGCILYRMFAGNLLFKDSFEVLKYSWTAPSSPLALDDIGFSIPCVSFLRDVLQPIPGDRPSAEDCLKKAWIMNEVSGPEYSIGKDLYTRLSKINQRAPNLDSFSDMVANRAADSSSVQ